MGRGRGSLREARGARRLRGGGLVRRDEASALSGEGRRRTLRARRSPSVQAASAPSRAAAYARAALPSAGGRAPRPALLADVGSRIPRPEGEALFVDESVYDWGFDEVLSISGYYEPTLRGRARDACLRLSVDWAVPDRVRTQARRNYTYHARSVREVFGERVMLRELDTEPSARDEVWAPTNPSIARGPDGRLRSTLRLVNYDVRSYAVRTPDGLVRTRTLLLTLDEDLSVVGFGRCWIGPGTTSASDLGSWDLRTYASSRGGDASGDRLRLLTETTKDAQRCVFSFSTTLGTSSVSYLSEASNHTFIKKIGCRSSAGTIFSSSTPPIRS